MTDTAHREVLRRMETYGKDPDASDYEVAKDTVRLLCALNHRLRHFQAQILADIKIRESYNQTLRPQPQADTPPEARHHRYTLLSTTPPTIVHRPERTHTIDADGRRGSSPIRRPTETEEIQPQTNSSTPGTTTSDEPRPPDADKGNLYSATHIYRETKFLELLNKSTDDDLVDPKPHESEITMDQQQLQTPEHATPVKSDDSEHTSTTPDHTGLVQDTNVPKPERTITEENTKTGVSPMNKYMMTMGDTAAYCKYSPSTQTKLLPKQTHGARPHRRPGDRTSQTRRQQLPLSTPPDENTPLPGHTPQRTGKNLTRTET